MLKLQTAHLARTSLHSKYTSIKINEYKRKYKWATSLRRITWEWESEYEVGLLEGMTEKLQRKNTSLKIETNMKDRGNLKIGENILNY